MHADMQAFASTYRLKSAAMLNLPLQSFEVQAGITQCAAVAVSCYLHVSHHTAKCSAMQQYAHILMKES